MVLKNTDETKSTTVSNDQNVGICFLPSKKGGSRGVFVRP